MLSIADDVMRFFMKVYVNIKISIFNANNTQIQVHKVKVHFHWPSLFLSKSQKARRLSSSKPLSRQIAYIAWKTWVGVRF